VAHCGALQPASPRNQGEPRRSGLRRVRASQLHEQPIHLRKRTEASRILDEHRNLSKKFRNFEWARPHLQNEGFEATKTETY
jgi:hypothetical protein